MLRKLGFGVFIVLLVLFGLLAQLSAYLFEMAPLDTDEVGPSAPYGATGPHLVGVEDVGADGAANASMIWYPAAVPLDTDFSTTYSYEINMFGSGSAIALATFEGEAIRNATADLSAGPFPVVVLSPGFGIGGASYAWLAEHLASYGFVVISLDHDESLDPGVLWRSTVERPQAALGLIDHIQGETQPGGEFEGLIDADVIAVVGHSFGGYTAQVTGGARLHSAAFEGICDTADETDDPIGFLCDALLPRLDDMAELAGLEEGPSGVWPAWNDAAVDAVVSLAGDAAVFGPPGLSELNVPVMAIGGTADVDSPYTWGTGLTFEHASADRRIEIALQGAEHMIFAGECERARRILALVSLGFCSDPVWDRDSAHALISHFVTAFLLAELMQDGQASEALSADDSGFPGVTHRAEGF